MMPPRTGNVNHLLATRHPPGWRNREPHTRAVQFGRIPFALDGIAMPSASTVYTTHPSTARNQRIRPGDAIAIICVDQHDPLTLKPIRAWYCGMDGQLHVYLCQKPNGELYRWRTGHLELCRRGDLPLVLAEHEKLVKEGKSVSS